jgi:hypothetical protein
MGRDGFWLRGEAEWPKSRRAPYFAPSREKRDYRTSQRTLLFIADIDMVIHNICFYSELWRSLGISFKTNVFWDPS